MAAVGYVKLVRAAPVCRSILSVSETERFQTGLPKIMNRAAVAIPEKLFFKIGEVCELTGVQAHVLRYWESEFPMLAPQKNRAGQRTYRKRDVEMALRIKELLYDDQYTIAGAKKKLASELRGASKLKVVTPEMSAAQTAASPTPAPVPSTPPVSAQPGYQANASAASTSITDEQRLAVRRLASQLRELLSILDAGEAEQGSR
jgi:DNA-binding transcriptional MerR regulator